MTTSPSFAVSVHERHGTPTLFVHRLNHELETWTTFTSGESHDEVLGRLGFARNGEWATDTHGARHCAARRQGASGSV